MTLPARLAAAFVAAAYPAAVPGALRCLDGPWPDGARIENLLPARLISVWSITALQRPVSIPL